MTEEEEDVSSIDEDASPSCRQNISTRNMISRRNALPYTICFLTDDLVAREPALLLLLLFKSCCWFFRCSLSWMSFSLFPSSLGLLSHICVRSRAIEATTTQMICDAADKILRVWRRIASVMFTSAAVDKSRVKS